MEEETIDSLRRYRRTTLQTIEGEKRKLAGIDERLRAKIQEAVESLSEEGFDVGDVNLESDQENQKKSRKERLGPILPRGYWLYAVAVFLFETKKVHFHSSEFVEWVGVPRSERQRVFAALNSPKTAEIISALGGSRFSIREGVTQAALKELVDTKTAEGLRLDAIKALGDVPRSVEANVPGAGNGISEAA